jgi:hypothetical protein
MNQKLKDAQARLAADITASNEATKAFRAASNDFAYSSSAANYNALMKTAMAVQDARHLASESRQAVRTISQEQGAQA